MAVKAVEDTALEQILRVTRQAVMEAYAMGKTKTVTKTVVYKPLGVMASDALSVRKAVLDVCDLGDFGPGRHKRDIPPKWAAIVLLRDRLKLSFPEIAGFMGYADHTTMMYAYRNQEKYPEIKGIIEAAKRLLDGNEEE